MISRVDVQRAGDRHRVRLQPGLLRGQIVRNDERGCRIGLLATVALLLGGDSVELDVRVGPGACLELFDVAGTVAYHGRGRPASWRVTAAVAQGGSLVWSGQPFVVSDGADVDRSLELDLEPTARLTLRETLVLGRSGELGGRVRNRMALRLDGRPLLLEEHLLDPAALRTSPGLLGPHRVIDTLLYVGAEVPGEVSASRFALLGGHGTLTRYLGPELADSPLALTDPTASDRRGV